MYTTIKDRILHMTKYKEYYDCEKKENDCKNIKHDCI